jgi:hypothetical protein
MEMTETCPGCGLIVAGGRQGCQGLYDETAARALADPAYTPAQNLAFDAYCMQHLDTYCRSAKSYAAHLTRLCCGIEYAGDPAVYVAIQRWLNGKSNLVKPTNLPKPGNWTIQDVTGALDADSFLLKVRAWAHDVWQAYAPQHADAHEWIHSAIQNDTRRYSSGNR